MFNFNFTYKNTPDLILGRYDILLRKNKHLKSNVAIDVGCSIGGFPLTWSRYFSNVYCVDACYKNLEIARRNFQKFNIKNCNTFHFAGGSETGNIIKIINNKGAPYNNVVDGKSTIYKSRSDPRGSFTLENANTSFNDMLKFFNVEKIDFLKVDIEGAEYDFLFNRDLSCVDVLAIECHFSENENTKELTRHLQNYFNIVTSVTKGKHSEYLMLNKKYKNEDFYSPKPSDIRKDQVEFLG